MRPEPPDEVEALNNLIAEVRTTYPDPISRSRAMLDDDRLRHLLYMAFWAGFNRGEYIATRNQT